jgi:hypothetical protein
MLLSVTLNILPTATKEFDLINSNNFSLEGLLGLTCLFLLCSAEHLRHLVLTEVISQPQSIHFFFGFFSFLVPKVSV